MENYSKKVGHTLKPPKAFFEWCSSQIPTYKWKNKHQEIKSSNRENCPIIVKQLSARSRLDFPTKCHFFAIVLVTRKRIEIQSYAFWSTVRNGIQTIESEQTNLERFSSGKHLKAYYYNDRWNKGLLSNYGFMSSPYTNTKFYSNGWESKANRLKELKYLDLQHLNCYTLGRYFKYNREIEYCQNIHANKLAEEILFPDFMSVANHWTKSIDFRICTFNWLRKNKARIKNTNKSFSDVQLELLIHKAKGKYVQGIEKYLTYQTFKKIPKEVSCTKFQKWVIKNEVNFNQYLDYLAMLDELQIEKNNDLVFMPRDFKAKHDDLAKTITRIKQEKQESYLTTPLHLHENFEMEIGDYVFVVPKNLKEIVNEGSALHHCVGGNRYLEGHKTGETTIMFIRKKEDKETPLYTLEYQKGKIIQIQGKYDRVKISEEVQEIAQQWTKKVKRLKTA